MNKIYYLSTCSTCKRIISEIQNCSKSKFILQDIKNEPISQDDIDRFYEQTLSYESLFNKRAQKFKLITASHKPTDDLEYKALILKEYTYLKRPVVEFQNEFFIGNSKATLDKILKKLNCKK